MTTPKRVLVKPVLHVQPVQIAPQDRSASLEVLKRRFLSYPQGKADKLFSRISTRVREGSLDRYDAVILFSALLTNMTAKDLADIYFRGRASFTGVYARQHIHETIIKRNILSIMQDD
jgi:hypothetical protein